MSRPKRGEKGHNEATKKWRETMMEKLGGEENYKEYFRKLGKKGGQNSHEGGFASFKVGKDGLTGWERAKLAGAIGGFKSRRGPAKKEES